MLSPLEQGSAVVLQLAKDAVSIAVAAAPTPTDVSLPIPTVNILAAAAAAATATATNVPDVGDNDDDYRGECRLMGSFALIVQAALGGLALLSLVYKRWRERPQRPVKIWFFDVSKQVFGSVLVHIANVFMSMLTSGRFSFETADSPIGPMATMLLRRDDDDYSPNPCSFYLLNLGIDVSLAFLPPHGCLRSSASKSEQVANVSLPPGRRLWASPS